MRYYTLSINTPGKSSSGQADQCSAERAGVGRHISILCRYRLEELLLGWGEQIRV